MNKGIIGILAAVTLTLGFTGCSDPVEASSSGASAKLSALTVSSGTLSPEFSSKCTTYDVTVGNAVSEITITGTPSDSEASVSANNGQSQSLTLGANKIIITVTAKGGKKKQDYVVYVHRSPQISSNANLKTLFVDNGTLTPKFDPGTTEYSVNVDYSVKSITVTGFPEDTGADVSSNNYKAQSLTEGKNTITLSVTATDRKTKKDYVVNVYRSPNANLKSLTLDTGYLSRDFSSTTTSYSVALENSTTSITITGSPADSGATVGGDNGVAKTLNDGNNVVKITVTAKDGITKKDYVITVVRFGAPYTSATIGSLKYVPAGTFQQNDQKGNNSSVSAFRMSSNEVTRAHFSGVMGKDPSDTSKSLSTNDPVQQVNWYQAIAFCNKLSIKESLSPVYSVTVGGSPINWSTLSYDDIPIVSNYNWDAVTADFNADGYRLPTASEWMWAAMGAPSDGVGGEINTTGYSKAYAGATQYNVIGNYAWYFSNSTYTTHPVGTKRANALYLYDMSGNVAEWSWDLDGSSRVYRGGGWMSTSSECSVTSCQQTYPAYDNYDIGFRVVRK